VTSSEGGSRKAVSWRVGMAGAVGRGARGRGGQEGVGGWRWNGEGAPGEGLRRFWKALDARLIAWGRMNVALRCVVW
jgi:hypothetical protein